MVTKKKIKIIFSLLILHINFIDALDYCSNIYNDFQSGDYTTYNNVISCYKTFSYNKTESNKIIENLKKMWKLSVFSDDSLDPPNKEKLNLRSYDIIKQLDILKQKKFENDFSFQQELTKTFIPISDGHTLYQSNCYNSISFIQPLDIISYVENNSQRLYFSNILDNEMSSYVKKIYNLDLKKYSSLEILKINNISAIKYILEFSNDTVYHGKDLSSKFSYAISQHSYDYDTDSVEVLSGEFNKRQFLFPVNEFITFNVIRNGIKENIKIPWITKVNKYWNGKNSKDFWEFNCINTNSMIQKRKINYNYHIKNYKKRIYKEIKYNLTLTDSIPGGFIYILNNNTGIIQLNTFSPFRTSTNSYISRFKSAIDNLKQLGIKKLIVDGSNNKGGTMCIAYYVISTILNQQVQFATDVKLSPLSLELQNKAYYLTATEYVNPKTNNIYNKNDKFLLPAISLKRGGNIHNYSQPFLDECPLFNKTEKDHFNSVMIMTNGQCGSSCGIAMLGLKFLSKNTNIKINSVTLGGLYNHRMQLSSYIGGQEYPSGNIIDDVYSAGIEKKPFSPQKTNYRYNFDLTFREIRYPNIKSTNLDYQWNPSDYRIYWNKKNTNDPLSVYNEVDNLF